jgi:hypothetical protein
MSPESQKNNTAIILIAIIGVFGTIAAALITAVSNYNVEKLRQETELTRAALAPLPPQSEENQTSITGISVLTPYATLFPNVETMYYGTRMGMVVTVLSKQGIDSNNAIITTVHTRENAIAFCRDYASSAQEQCIVDELAQELKNQVSANCESGTFTNFRGGVYEFQGLNENGDAVDPKYVIFNVASGEVADGSFASGYFVNLDIFRALCPSRFSNDY